MLIIMSSKTRERNALFRNILVGGAIAIDAVAYAHFGAHLF
jgi:hypothetical protein